MYRQKICTGIIAADPEYQEREKENCQILIKQKNITNAPGYAWGVLN